MATTKKTKTTKRANESTKTVSLGTGRYWTPQPQIELQFTEETSYEACLAELLELAAEVKRATPASARWKVKTSNYYGMGCRVYLEMEGTKGEAERGMAVLRKVAG